MTLLFDQPEVLSTINIVQGFLYKDVPLLWIIGGIFIFATFILVILKIKFDILKINFTSIIIFIILIFWLPLLINFFYNNVYDFKENLEMFKHDVSGKRIIRYCNMDRRQGLNGEFCDLMPFIKVIKETIPKNSTVKISSKLGMSPYFYYYDLYALYNFVHDPRQADYVIFYYSPDYYFKNDILYQAKNDFNNLAEDRKIGKFSIIKRTGAYLVIFKKI